METYVHNPEIYRRHFVGYGLDGFSGARIQQRGRGVGQWWRKAKRYTIPLLKAGARMALPHVSRALKHVADASAAHFFPGNPAIQAAVNHMTGHVTKHIAKKAEKLLKGKKQRKRKHSATVSRGSKRNRTKSIFDD